jgi:hypothetical protein
MQNLNIALFKTKICDERKKCGEPSLGLFMLEDVEPGQVDVGVAVLGQPGSLAAVVDMTVRDDYLGKPGKIQVRPQEVPARLGGRTGVKKDELISEIQGVAMDRTHHIRGLDGKLARYHSGDTIPIVSLSG